jgi:hypothetical protein
MTPELLASWEGSRERREVAEEMLAYLLLVLRRPGGCSDRPTVTFMPSSHWSRIYSGVKPCGVLPGCTMDRASPQATHQTRLVAHGAPCVSEWQMSA